uniref:Foie-gras_1 domain-containing protein n=1 Tax=Macrostomum lignano TaxID=282301 RepID=A0A1I8FD87_9PLAT
AAEALETLRPGPHRPLTPPSTPRPSLLKLALNPLPDADAPGPPRAFELEAWRLVFGRLEPLFADLGCASLGRHAGPVSPGPEADSLVDRASKAFGRAWPTSTRMISGMHLVQRLYESRQWERLDLATTWAPLPSRIQRRRCEQINLLALTSAFYTKSVASVLHIAKDFCCRYQGPQHRAEHPGPGCRPHPVQRADAASHGRPAAPPARYPLLLMTAQGFLLTGKYRRALLALTHLRRVRQDDPLVPCWPRPPSPRWPASGTWPIGISLWPTPVQCSPATPNCGPAWLPGGFCTASACCATPPQATSARLNAQPEGETAEQRQRNDLRPTAAHNLLVLYKSVGNEAMVSRLLREHLVIH